MIHFNTQLILSSLILFFIQDGVSEASKNPEELCKEEVNKLCGTENTNVNDCYKHLYYNTLYPTVKGYSQKYFKYLRKHITFGKIEKINNYCKNFYKDHAKKFLENLDIKFYNLDFDIKECIQALNIYIFPRKSTIDLIVRFVKTEEIQNFEFIFFDATFHDKKIKKFKEKYEFKIKQIVAKSMKSIKKIREDFLEDYALSESLVYTREDESIKKIEKKGKMSVLIRKIVSEQRMHKDKCIEFIKISEDYFYKKYNETFNKIQNYVDLKEIDNEDIENIEISENDVSLQTNKEEHTDNIEIINKYFINTIDATKQEHISNIENNIKEFILMLYVDDIFLSTSLNDGTLFGPQWCENISNIPIIPCQ